MDTKRLEEHVNDICGVSKFFDPKKYSRYYLDGPALKECLLNSHKRLEVLESKFEEIGFKASREEFSYKQCKAINTIFRKGKKRKNEIWIVAHHDYCAGLGAEDNASALAVMLDVARYLKNSERSPVFVSFDLEEVGLVGSKCYVRNSDLVNVKYVIDLECLGSGKDIIICKSVYGARSDKKLVNGLEKTASSLGYNFITEDFSYFIADHVPFARKKIKTVEICSINHELYLKYGGNKVLFDGDNWWRVNAAHTRRDIPENLNFENLVRVGEVLVKFIESEK